MSRDVRRVEGLGSRLLTEKPGRAALTIAGVVLGVAMFTGSLVTSITAIRGFDEFADSVSGFADVLATPPGGSLNTVNNPQGGAVDASTIDALAALPEVERAVGLLAIPTSFTGPSGETLQRVNERVAAVIVGVDLNHVGHGFDLDVESGRLPRPGADEIVLPIKVSDSLGAEVGDEVSMATREGTRSLRVVGLLANRGMARIDGIGFSSMDVVRTIAGRPGAVSQIALDLRPGVDPKGWVSQYQDSAPEGVTLASASSFFVAVGGQVRLLSGMVSAVGAGLLFSAGFLVYLTLAMSVAERTRLFGTVVALGATRRQVRRVVLVEALAVGFLGSIPGIALGIGVAFAMRLATGRLLAEMGTPDLIISPWALAISGLVGVATTVASALVPARRASRIDPTAAIRATDADTPLRPASLATGIFAAGIGGVAMMFGGLGTTVVGLVLVLVGVVLLVPHLVAPIARVLAPLVIRLFGSGGRIAIQHLVRDRTRSGYTLALVMIVMAMTITISVSSSSFTQSLERQLTAQLGDDLTVAGASSLPDSFIAALGEVDGVDGVTTQNGAAAAFTVDGNSEDVRIEGIDPDTYFDVASFSFVHGSPGELINGLRTGSGIAIPDGTARRLSLAVGDSITIDTLHGPRAFQVVATVERAAIPPIFITSQDTATTAFGAQGIEEALVRITPGSRPDDVRADIEHELGNRATFIVSTASEVKADTRAQIGGGINSFYVLLLLAGVVGTFGLANTMAMSVTKRYREIGVLRAIGARRANIRDMAIAEAITLVTVAFVLAVPLGLALAKPIFDLTAEQFADFTIQYRIPWAILPALLGIGAVTAVGAAVWPARRAVHIDIEEALRFE